LLRRHARALAALAVIALLTPSFAGAATAQKSAAAPFSLVICTTEGLVSVPLNDEAPASHGEHDDCPACLRVDLATALPPADTFVLVPPLEAVGPATPGITIAQPRGPPHARPDPTGPPART
jgi:hypothetical protein